MKSLSIQSATIFFQLINQLGTSGHRKFFSEGYMPLSVEWLGHIHTTSGNGQAYSLCHYFTQNGDLMRDPEMCFLVMPHNNINHLPDQVFPYSYQLDPLGIYQESMQFEPDGSIVINTNPQEQHARFANDWLINIQSQGFSK